MSKTAAFLFALTTVALLTAVGILLSYGMVLLALLALVLSVFMTGAGFIFKARARRKNTQSQE
ncbi:DUF5325 family protein [Paenibacillus turpanensis]|uniref:DUF5325 family protein n=1 Tax=Paenibacillus turpanensis TaxID=2689078 RepID=UPI00140BACF3|nr:DUF5325 family protein [Paenibacillus turpanensis]